MPLIATLLLPIASMIISVIRETSALEVFKLYDPSTAEWMADHSSTTWFGILWIAGGALLFVPVLILMKIIKDRDNFLFGFFVTWPVLFFCSCVGLNSARLMSNVFNEDNLLEKMNLTMTDFSNSDDGRNHTWSITEDHFNCTGLYSTSDVFGCFDSLRQAIQKYRQSAFMCLLFSNIPPCGVVIISACVILMKILSD